MEIVLPKYVKFTVILLGLLLMIWFLQTFKSILMPLAFGLLFSFLLLPLNRDLEKWHIPRTIAVLCSIIIVVVVMALVIWFFTSQLISLTSELDNISSNIDALIDKVQLYLFNNFGIAPTEKSALIQNAVSNLQDFTTSFVGSTISMTTGALTFITIVPIFVFCFLYYRDHLQKFMFKFIDKDRRSAMIQTLTDIQVVVQSYISGLMIVILIVSLLNSAGLLLLGIKYAIFFGVFASVLTVIPYIGILIGALLPALFTLATTGHLIDAILVILVFSFVQFLEGNFITPFVVGSKVSINPFSAILALLIGGEIWGAAGMIISIPAIATLKVLFDAYPPLEPFGFLLADLHHIRKKPSGKIRKLFHKARERAEKQLPKKEE
jgi:predicted PurR-regulated permease PerM